MAFRDGGRSHGGGHGGFNRGPREEREMHDAVCSECNAQTKVPFKPTEGKPVYCRECYMKRKNSQ